MGLVSRALDACTGEIRRFVDLFAGSGVVARLARLRGFDVVANDWEYYSYVLNHAYLTIGKSELPRLFAAEGGIDAILAEMNSLDPPRPEETYVARYYAPSKTEDADYRRERLFYTRENALAIDAIRSEIDRRFPEHDDPRRALLLALLLYEAATHTNTSGVFKAYHKGFGGHGRDALRRIMAPVQLEHPVLVDGSPALVYRSDAHHLVRELELGKTDVVYLDPPYRQHQYGSNYHLLNTIALWDKPPVDMTYDDNGVLKDKAGIRKDWRRTRSAYCSAGTALEAFRELIERIGARYILVSYSTDGMIPFDRLLDACEKRGRVTITSAEYIQYRGGKQSMDRRNGNVEFVLTVDTLGTQGPLDRRRIDVEIGLRRLSEVLGRPFRKEGLESEFGLVAEGGEITVDGCRARVVVEAGYRIANPAGIVAAFARLSAPQLTEITERFVRATCRSKSEELGELLRIADEHPVAGYDYVKRIPTVLRKIAHKKYRREFAAWLERIRSLASTNPAAYDAIARKIDEIEAVACRRLNG